MHDRSVAAQNRSTWQGSRRRAGKVTESTNSSSLSALGSHSSRSASRSPVDCWCGSPSAIHQRRCDRRGAIGGWVAGLIVVVGGHEPPDRPAPRPGHQEGDRRGRGCEVGRRQGTSRSGRAAQLMSAYHHVDLLGSRSVSTCWSCSRVRGLIPRLIRRVWDARRGTVRSAHLTEPGGPVVVGSACSGSARLMSRHDAAG